MSYLVNRLWTPYGAKTLKVYCLCKIYIYSILCYDHDSSVLRERSCISCVSLKVQVMTPITLPMMKKVQPRNLILLVLWLTKL